MKLRNVLTVLAAAAVTIAVTLGLAALLSGGRAEARAVAVTPVISRPEFVSQGCKFTLKADKKTYEGGESPVFEVTATNTTKQDVKASVWINVTAVAPTSPMSRMLPIPRSLWSEQVSFSLEPGETKTQKVTCGAKLPAGQNVSIILSDKKETVMAGAFPVTQAAQAGGPNGANNVVPPRQQ
jgi:hypothetical protein